MKKMKNKEYSDNEWEELASLMSGEKEDKKDVLGRFMAEDIYNTEEKWKELMEMNSGKNINVDEAWGKVYSRLKENGLETESKPIPVRSLRISFIKIAAVVLLVIGLGSTALYLNNSGYLSKKITLTTRSDQKNLLVDLPDGSRIYLNRNTELSYRANFGKQRRNVHLSGEAFFNISPDVSKPFIIDAGKARVKVVGTSFNVITNNTDSAVEVYVKTGKVLLSDNAGDKSILIDPEFVGILDSKTSVKEINTNPNYMSWNTSHLEYSGQKLDVVFKDLKRVFNMDIIADDSSILEYPWTSPIENDPPDKIIRLICASFNLSCSKDGDVFHLSKK